jgi:hypothetical protein
MKNTIKEIILTKGLNIILDLIDEKTVSKSFDVMLDHIEKQVKNTTNQYDDVIVIPIIKVIRTAINIPQDEIIVINGKKEDT